MFVQFVQKSSSYFLLSMIHFVHAMSSAASVPGRMGSHTSALAASMVMRGSMTTVFRPFSRARSSASARPPVATELFDGSVPHSTRESTGESVK